MLDVLLSLGLRLQSSWVKSLSLWYVAAMDFYISSNPRLGLSLMYQYRRRFCGPNQYWQSGYFAMQKGISIDDKFIKDADINHRLIHQLYCQMSLQRFPDSVDRGHWSVMKMSLVLVCKSGSQHKLLMLPLSAFLECDTQYVRRGKCTC